ncbi:PGC-1 and ERR-induced regulator in muscle protein 1 [Mixophyes fleayi]|uniref:PGC-1 and ERR-induced regulator in muscle protein 1 n=1 Tax=Mixophyes fleayi TaxID=3061075 RepID=UPI003F4E3787
MDNFEYSIQINDRDWEEFYSTAEECGLMQVALATEEDLLLSDTEREDATHKTTSGKSRFIRVSLCPAEEERPAAQNAQKVVPLLTQTSYTWIGPCEDVLSGSEDEEIGSVTRFLCQKENLLCKKKDTKSRIDIPFPKPGEDPCTAIPYVEEAIVSPMSERLVEYLSVVNRDRNHHYGVDTEHQTTKTTIERSNQSVTFNGEEETGHSSNGPRVSVEPGAPSSTSVGLPYPNKSPDCVYNNQICLGQLGKLPNINKTSNETMTMSVTKMCQSHHVTTLPGSLGQNDQLDVDNEIYQPPRNDQTRQELGEPVCSKPNGVIHETLENVIQNGRFQVANKVMGISSAVEQNIPSSIAEKLDLHSSKSYIETATNITANRHEASANFDRDSAADHTMPTYNLVPDSATGQCLQNRSPPKPLPPASSKNIAPTVPEMYEFFFDDFSDTGMIETEIHMASRDGIMYTPDMYEYFFAEDKEENRTNENKDNKTQQVSSTNLPLASAPPEAASWPEAYEFFFSDGPQDEDRQGALVTVSPSQAQIAADLLKSFVAPGLQGSTVRRAHDTRSTGAIFIPQDSHGIYEETSVASPGSLVPYLSPSKSDACLVFLAFASWAMKTSDMQSSDGWKTGVSNTPGYSQGQEHHFALLANIGAVSAIRYLRRRSRRVWREPLPELGEET